MAIGKHVHRLWNNIVDWIINLDGQSFFLASSFSAIGWGLQVINPFTDVFSMFGPSLSYFIEIFPSELFWGGFILASGSVSLIGYLMKNKGVQQIGLSGVLFFRVLTLVFFAIKTHFMLPGLFDFVIWVMSAAIAMLKAKGANYIVDTSGHSNPRL